MHLPQGKWWWAAMMAIITPVLNCSLVLPPKPALSLIFLKRGLATVSPSCLGESWLSVVERMLMESPCPHAFHGLQATSAGLPSTPRCNTIIIWPPPLYL